MSQLPGPIEKRDILYGVKKLTPAESAKLVESLKNEGWISDAIDFLGYSKNIDGLEKMRQIAVDEGNTFLFLKVSRMLNESEPSKAALLTCAQKAESLGKTRYAIKAYEKLEMIEKVEELRGRIATDGDIIAEAEQSVFIPVSEEEYLEEEES